MTELREMASSIQSGMVKIGHHLGLDLSIPSLRGNSPIPIPSNHNEAQPPEM